jgi:hypothetical protein
MFTTAYLQNSNIIKASSHLSGGICKLWFVPINWINSFSGINPLTQNLFTEPTLLAGKNWIGPIVLPDTQKGYEEKPTDSTAGIFYKRKITALIPGFGQSMHHQTQNMVHQSFCVIAKLRTTNAYIVVGNKQFGLSFTSEFASGNNAADAATIKIQFFDDCKNKAAILNTFSLDVQPTFPSNGLITEDGFFITDESNNILLV